MPFSNATPINLQSIIDATDNGFVVIDKDYNIVAANKAYYTSYGISSDEIIGSKCHQVSHHSDVPCHLNGEDCPHKKVFETKAPHQVLHIHYDYNNEEEHVRIKGSPVYGTDGELYLGEAVFPITKNNELSCDKQRMLGTSPAFLACIEEMAGAASADAPILLNGESGVGKELAAKFIHFKSSRKAQPFISIDCASISEGIFESELFGHERGAFTGCVGRRTGLVESAKNGTLFLDEIGEVPLALQGRLLRVLETGHYRRLGGRKDLHVDVRVICATHDNLRKMVEQGTFRADLYYRIAGISITIPPLRERRSDIAPLVKTLLKKIHSPNGTAGRISEEALLVLQQYDYPGNIRELHNILQKSVTASTAGLVTPDLLQLNNFTSVYINPLADRRKQSRTIKATAPTTNRSLVDVEATHIESLLHQHDGHRAKVAGELCISERTLYRKLKQYNLQDVGKQQNIN
ncbi:Response regulator of zinc sigma-54-dependent two-component system [hydrothermal vent metagenome]|uniref:Response regulator of zinc sigma-54-dependent two-component system n=1 Tax=hydrothermal vent metagenome TaxID=652676 RepID=A0A3B0WF46_9ZZZZ